MFEGILRFVGLIIGLALLVSCGGGDRAELLLGSWKPDENFPKSIEYVAFKVDGTFGRYTRFLETSSTNTVAGRPRYGGNYTVEGTHIELMGTGGPDGGLLCNGDREYWEITELEENSFTIKILDDECHTLNLGGHDAMNSDVITFARCTPEQSDNKALIECIPVSE